MGTIINTDGALRLGSVDKKMLQLCKIRQDRRCYNCKKTITKGSYCLGGWYQKICINCIEKFINNYKKSIRLLYTFGEEVEEEFKKNKEKFIKNNLISGL